MAKNNTLIWVIVAILAVVIIWGLIGANEADKIGITCDFGIGESLCWNWHTNIIGQIQENIQDATNNNRYGN